MKISKDTVVAITGASRGIGREAGLAFAKRGASVVLLARDLKRLEETAEQVRKIGSKALVLVCDVSNEDSCHAWVPKALEAFGKIDVLVNNAGYGHYAGVAGLKTNDLDRIFRTNLYGAIWCTQAVLPHMAERRSGHIVNVSTIISRRSLPFMSAYCMTKFAMNAFDESLRLEVCRLGIGVSLVCPGLTATDFQTNSGQDGIRPLMSHEKGMRAARVGEAIVRAVERKRRRVGLTASGKALWAVNTLSPTFVDWVMDRMYARRAATP